MMNIKDFVDYFAEKNEITKSKAREIIDMFVDTYKSGTIEKGGVNILGFMKSEIVDVPERETRNPKTGEKIVSPAKKVVKVKIAKKFRDMDVED